MFFILTLYATCDIGTNDLKGGHRGAMRMLSKHELKYCHGQGGDNGPRT